MGKIADRVRLFSAAYQLALAHLEQHAGLKHPSTAQKLAVSIRFQIGAGVTDPVRIAAEAIRSLQAI
jgi:hypothetical protein